MDAKKCNSVNGGIIYGQFPYDIVNVEEDSIKEIERLVRDVADKDSVLVGPKKYFLPGLYKNYYQNIYNFKAKPDDILLIGFPRTGTTLHSEMVWQIENNLDFETARKTILTHRFPILDLSLTMGDLNYLGMLADGIRANQDIKDIAKGYSTITLERLSKIQEKRFLRTHLPISLLSPSFFKSGCKVIYCARNPKDSIVSYYHVMRYFRPKEAEDVSFRSFWKCLRNNLIAYCPYFEHIKEAWAKRNDENFLFLFYEDTVKDMKQSISKVSEFLGKTLTNDELEKLADYLSLEKFQKNKSVNLEHLNELGLVNNEVKFIRKGKCGGWREYFIGDLEEEVEEWIRENLKDSDLVFPEDQKQVVSRTNIV